MKKNQPKQQLMWVTLETSLALGELRTQSRLIVHSSMQICRLNLHGQCYCLFPWLSENVLFISMTEFITDNLHTDVTTSVISCIICAYLCLEKSLVIHNDCFLYEVWATTLASYPVDEQYLWIRIATLILFLHLAMFCHYQTELYNHQLDYKVYGIYSAISQN